MKVLENQIKTKIIDKLGIEDKSIDIKDALQELKKNIEMINDKDLYK